MLALRTAEIAPRRLLWDRSRPTKPAARHVRSPEILRLNISRRLRRGIPDCTEVGLHLRADRHLYRLWRAGARPWLQRRMGGLLDGAGMGGTGAGDHRVRARHGLDRHSGGDRRRVERHAAFADGGCAAAAHQDAADTLSTTPAAGAF